MDCLQGISPYLSLRFCCYVFDFFCKYKSLKMRRATKTNITLCADYSSVLFSFLIRRIECSCKPERKKRLFSTEDKLNQFQSFCTLIISIYITPLPFLTVSTTQTQTTTQKQINDQEKKVNQTKTVAWYFGVLAKAIRL